MFCQYLRVYPPPVDTPQAVTSRVLFKYRFRLDSSLSFFAAGSSYSFGGSFSPHVRSLRVDFLGRTFVHPSVLRVYPLSHVSAAASRGLCACAPPKVRCFLIPDAH